MNCDLNFLSKKHVFFSLLKLCYSPNHLSQIHAQIILSGFQNDTSLISELVRFAALSQSQNLSYARSLLRNNLGYSSPLPWNVVIRGYASSDSPQTALWVFEEMRGRGIRPNKFTFPFLFKACATLMALQEGRQFHSNVLKSGFNLDLYIQNSLISLYGSCKKIREACQVFDEMPERTVVSWNTIITGCVENFRFGGGIEYFLKMRNCGFEPDETTMVIILSACAELGNLSLGRWVHSQVVQKEMHLNHQLGTALVDMYSKSGAVAYGRLVFERMEEKNVWTWSAMILGLAQHGFAKEALELFKKMRNSSVRPNYVTFLGVLCACSHAGLVYDGHRYFDDMQHIYRIKPMMIHYGVMVDVIGRAGRLREAYAFIMNMPVEPDPIVWRTLLSACSVHDINDIDDVGDKVRKKLLELEPRRGGNFIMVANMCAEVGMWEQAANARRAMRDRGVKKMAGESWVELGGSIYSFFSGFDTHADFGSIYELLDVLNLHMQIPS